MMPKAMHKASTYVEDAKIPQPKLVQLEPAVEIGLNVAIVAVHDYEPVVLAIRPPAGRRDMHHALPSGPFSPINHRTLEEGLRSWAHDQTGLELGYAEQLYTFGDRGRHARPGDLSPHVVSIGYVATSESNSAEDLQSAEDCDWHSWYNYFPWEDRRGGVPELLTRQIMPRLKDWARKPASRRSASFFNRPDRLRICFGAGNAAWDEEKVLERYELLYEAGLVEEAARDGREAAGDWKDLPRLGTPMRFDNRRILATAIGRLRGKIKYRTVIFELITDEFTLFELQKTVQAILGTKLHKQNFRRLVEGSRLVEPTDLLRTGTGGRPAMLYRFRREVMMERPAPGVQIRHVRH